MKKVYIVYSEEGNIGKKIKVFDFEFYAAKYARDKGLKVIEKTLLTDIVYGK